MLRQACGERLHHDQARSPLAPQIRRLMGKKPHLSWKRRVRAYQPELDDALLRNSLWSLDRGRAQAGLLSSLDEIIASSSDPMSR